MKDRFQLGDLLVIIDSDKIVYDLNKAQIHSVEEDDDFVFGAISCAARPVAFSIVNQLYKLNREDVIKACDLSNNIKEIVVLSTDDYHLMLSPFVERFTFFGEDQARDLTNDVIDECKKIDVKSLRITQFCMMRHETMPIFPQFKGIIKALTSRKDSSLKIVFFDVPDKDFYEIQTLIRSYENELINNI